jgi:hypothetical protein
MLLCSALMLSGCSGQEQEGETQKSPSTAPGEGASGMLPTAPEIKVAALQDQEIEVGCAKCTYKLPGVEGCTTAVVVSGVPMVVGGLDVSAHDHRFCSGAGQAVVSGEVKGTEFVASKFELSETPEG